MNRVKMWIGGGMAVGVCLLIAGVSPTPATVGWLPIPPEDLAMKDNPASPGADAMILYRENGGDTRKKKREGDSDEE